MACYGPIGALTRAPLDVIASEPRTRAMLQAAMDEVVAVAAAHGVTLPETANTIGNFAPNSTFSTLRDVVSGSPSELLELAGAVSRYGAAAEPPVPTPTHDFVLAALMPQERLARGERVYSLDGVDAARPHPASKL